MHSTPMSNGTRQWAVLTKAAPTTAAQKWRWHSIDHFEVWERIELRADDYIDAGDDEVVVFFHEVAMGRESGAVMETDGGTVNTVQDGKIARVRGYMERSQALEAAGLSE